MLSSSCYGEVCYFASKKSVLKFDTVFCIEGDALLSAVYQSTVI